MIDPVFASVRPRVIGADGECRPLEDAIERLLSGGDKDFVVLEGAAGSGKTTALRHLAAFLSSRPEWQRRCRLVDTSGELAMSSEPMTAPGCLSIATARATSVDPSQRLRIAPWGRDDAIEYVLAKYSTKCTSIMSRIRGEFLCDGLPFLWTLAIDQLAADSTLPDIKSALLRHLEKLKLTAEDQFKVGRWAWAAISGQTSIDSIVGTDADAVWSDHQDSFLLLEPIQHLLACEYYISQLKSSRGQIVLKHRLPDDLLPMVGDKLRHDSDTLLQLQNVLVRKTDRTLHAAAATLLIAVDPAWRPRKSMREADLQEATLNGAIWPNIDLRGADLSNASLRDANLSHSGLQYVTLHSANLRHANLEGADMTGGVSLAYCDATGARFQNANLAGAVFDEAELDGANFDGAILEHAFFSATLIGASFRRTALEGAVFVACRLSDADFSDADLQNAIFDSLDLTSCDFSRANLERASLQMAVLEDVCWDDLQLSFAILRDACLTGSQLRRANMRWADLTRAKLAEIDWENADLRYANLTGAIFHMGSSRGGLVDSILACEGSRTGFYTDDFHEQSFKAPEEIRKANLRGADLRGAVLTGVDFYLVDLRGARLDEHQRQYAKNCGAILADRVVD